MTSPFLSPDEWFETAFEDGQGFGDWLAGSDIFGENGAPLGWPDALRDDPRGFWSALPDAEKGWIQATYIEAVLRGETPLTRREPPSSTPARPPPAAAATPDPDPEIVIGDGLEQVIAQFEDDLDTEANGTETASGEGPTLEWLDEPTESEAGEAREGDAEETWDEWQGLDAEGVVVDSTRQSPPPHSRPGPPRTDDNSPLEDWAFPTGDGEAAGDLGFDTDPSQLIPDSEAAEEDAARGPSVGDEHTSTITLPDGSVITETSDETGVIRRELTGREGNRIGRLRVDDEPLDEAAAARLSGAGRSRSPATPTPAPPPQLETTPPPSPPAATPPSAPTTPSPMSDAASALQAVPVAAASGCFGLSRTVAIALIAGAAFIAAIALFAIGGFGGGGNGGTYATSDPIGDYFAFAAEFEAIADPTNEGDINAFFVALDQAVTVTVSFAGPAQHLQTRTGESLNAGMLIRRPGEPVIDVLYRNDGSSKVTDVTPGISVNARWSDVDTLVFELLGFTAPSGTEFEFTTIQEYRRTFSSDSVSLVIEGDGNAPGPEDRDQVIVPGGGGGGGGAGGGATDGASNGAVAANSCEAIREQRLILELTSADVQPTIPLAFSASIADAEGFPTPALAWSSVPAQTAEIVVFVTGISDENAVVYAADPQLWWNGVPRGGIRWTLSGVDPSATSLARTSLSSPPPAGTTEQANNVQAVVVNGERATNKFVGPDVPGQQMMWTVFALCDPEPSGGDDYTAEWLQQRSIATGWFISEASW